MIANTVLEYLIVYPACKLSRDHEIPDFIEGSQIVIWM